MGNTVRVVEIVGYALIILIGLRLLWVKGRAFLHLLRSAAHDDVHAHKHSHHHTDQDHHAQDHSHVQAGHAHHGHDHSCVDEASAWGHAHAPESAELRGKHWLGADSRPSLQWV